MEQLILNLMPFYPSLVANDTTEVLPQFRSVGESAVDNRRISCVYEYVVNPINTLSIDFHNPAL
jgi:hypothetical protein